MRKRGRPATGTTPRANFRLDSRALKFAEKLIGKIGTKNRSDVLRQAIWFGLQIISKHDERKLMELIENAENC
jgi:hypothetical protein